MGPCISMLICLDTPLLTRQYPAPKFKSEKEALRFMPDPKRRSLALFAAVGLVVSLLLTSCGLGGSQDVDEANRLNQSAGEDIKEIERLVQVNKDREIELTRAINTNDHDKAKQIINESVTAIDRGLERGRSAADKFDKASKLDIDSAIKTYLSLRAQSVNKAIEAFNELRKGLIVLRDSTGSSDRAVTENAKNEIQQATGRFDVLISESEKLESQADDIARRNPDKIKPGR